MPFTLQDPASGLFWSSGIFGRVQLGVTPNTYVLEGSSIKNVETGNYVNHRADLLHEGGEPEEFVFEADGTITTQGKSVTASQFVHVMDGEATKWVKTEDEAVEDDVPISRASALIEEALNASKACGCECGCAAGCEGCECKDCECPKAEPEAEDAPESDAE
jgi:hypothetical protein